MLGGCRKALLLFTSTVVPSSQIHPVTQAPELTFRALKTDIQDTENCRSTDEALWCLLTLPVAAGMDVQGWFPDLAGKRGHSAFKDLPSFWSFA